MYSIINAKINSKKNFKILIGVSLILFSALLWFIGAVEHDIFSAVFCIGLAVAGAIFSIVSFSAKSDLIKNISKYMPIEQLCDKIENDIRSKNYLLLQGDISSSDLLVVCNDYVFVFTTLRQTYIPTENLLWSYYRKDTKQAGTIYIWSTVINESVDVMYNLDVIGKCLDIFDKNFCINIGFDEKLKEKRDSNYNEFIKICTEIKSKKVHDRNNF